jgi:hypothetical protein
MNIHLPAILGFTRYQGFDPSPNGDESLIEHDFSPIKLGCVCGSVHVWNLLLFTAITFSYI